MCLQQGILRDGQFVSVSVSVSVFVLSESSVWSGWCFEARFLWPNISHFWSYICLRSSVEMSNDYVVRWDDLNEIYHLCRLFWIRTPRWNLWSHLRLNMTFALVLKKCGSWGGSWINFAFSFSVSVVLFISDESEWLSSHRMIAVGNCFEVRWCAVSSEGDKWKKIRESAMSSSVLNSNVGVVIVVV